MNCTRSIGRICNYIDPNLHAILIKFSTAYVAKQQACAQIQGARTHDAKSKKGCGVDGKTLPLPPRDMASVPRTLPFTLRPDAGRREVDGSSSLRLHSAHRNMILLLAECRDNGNAHSNSDTIPTSHITMAHTA
jgi:hypothetical protein